MTTAALRKSLQGLKRSEMTDAQRQIADALGEAPNRSKYGNKIIKTEDGTFHSKSEHLRWLDLKNLQRAGGIFDLRRQVPFDIHTWAGGEKAVLCTYRADFTYREGSPDAPLTVEDVKGPEGNDTKEFEIKRRGMRLEHGIEIKIVRKT